MCDATVPFQVLCFVFDGVQGTKKGPVKRKYIRTFLDQVYTDHEFYSALRLMLPAEDRARTYGLKESVLGKCLTDALDLSEESADAQKLINWRKGGTRAGSNAGNFALIATEVLFRRQRATSAGLTIKDANDLLDRLVLAATTNEKVSILREMISKTNVQEMKWLIMIILKDLKLGISRTTILSEFHPDAEDLYNVTSELKEVCERLRNRNERLSRQDIQVGKAVRPQLAARVGSVEDAWKKFHGKEVVVECKFDGYRIQLHKDGTKLYFYTRNLIDHQIFKEGMADVLITNVLPEKCILDGELAVWDNSTNAFAPFGKNREAAIAARDGLETSQQLCYVAFDLLYYGSSSVVHLPLRERQELLCKAVRPVRRRLELLSSDRAIGTQQSFDSPKWSLAPKNADQIKRFFESCVENGDEGIIIKDLESKWEPNDRKGKWLKFKPDYDRENSDLDVLIIGGYFGSGQQGGQVAQFLLGIAEKPKADEYPTTFLSFCKVGTGLSALEREHLVQKLTPYFRRNEKNSKPPSCYKVTNHAKERPDVWVDRPDKSVILEIHSDVRCIDSEVFAAPYALRFPRVDKVRYEKPWYDCLDVQTLLDMVRAGKGSTFESKGHRKLDSTSKVTRGQKKARSSFLPLVPSHMWKTDVSNVQHTTQIFTHLVFYLVNNPVEHSKESLHKLVAENGGSFSMNLNDAVTHAIASERKGIKFQAAAAHGDVIHFSWIMDCCTAKAMLPVSPKYFLHLSDQTKEKRRDDIDDYGDHYCLDLDVNDVKQIFTNIDTAALSTDPDKLARAKKKYCSSSPFCQFSDCHFYFHKPIHSTNPDSHMVAETALKRQELEVSMHAGDVSKTLNADVTHMIVYTSKQALPFRTIVKSMPYPQRKLLASDKLKILSHEWIDDHKLGTCGHPVEDCHDLRDPSFRFTEDVPNQTKMGMARVALQDSLESSPLLPRQ